eukprot:117185_1
MSPYHVIHEFNHWNDIFKLCVMANNIQIQINESDLFLRRHTMNSYALQFMKNAVMNQIKDCDAVSAIPKTYLNLIIEQHIFQTLCAMFSGYRGNDVGITLRKTLIDKQKAIYKAALVSVSNQFNSYLLSLFSVLNWKEKYRIVYQDTTYYQLILHGIRHICALNMDILEILNEYLCGLYVGFITKCGGYIIIPKYHRWNLKYQDTKCYGDIPLDVTFFEQNVSIFCFFEQMQNEIEMCLHDAICIGWDYYHSSNHLYAKPGYDYGVQLTLHSIRKEVLNAIQSAKMNEGP